MNMLAMRVLTIAILLASHAWAEEESILDGATVSIPFLRQRTDGSILIGSQFKQAVWITDPSLDDQEVSVWLPKRSTIHTVHVNANGASVATAK